MNINILSIFRVIVYLWVGIEFANLSYLYLAGYKNNKPTPIIKALQVMFVCLSIQFLAYAFLPVLLETDAESHKVAVTWLPLILVPVGITVRLFREQSLKKQTMDLPKGNKKNE